MPAYARGLPSDVVAITLQHLREVDLITFCSALRTCSEWHDLGIPVLWTDISLKPIQIRRFSKVSNQHYQSKVQSITIMWQVYELKGAFAQPNVPSPRWCVLDALSDQLSQYPNLKTVSFFLKDAELYNSQYTLRCIELSKLVRNLPDTVENLEIDTRGHEGYVDDITNVEEKNAEVPEDYDWNNHTSCVCPNIGACLPRLKHLRVRLASVCPSLFTRSTTLETFSLNLLTGMGTSSDNCDLALLGSFDKDAMPGLMESFQTNPISSRLRLCKLSIVTFTQGPFPDGHGKTIWTQVHFPIERKVKSYAVINGVQWNYLRSSLEYALDGRTKVVTGTFEELSDLLEDHAWITTTCGSRFPAAFATTPRGRSMRWKATASNLRGHKLP